MDEALRARLIDQTGAGVDWGLSPRGATLPRVVLTRVSGGPDYVLTGPSGLVTARVQADCYAASVGAAKLLARSVKAAISGWGSGDIDAVYVDAERDLSPETGMADTIGRVVLDLIVNHKE